MYRRRLLLKTILLIVNLMGFLNYSLHAINKKEEPKFTNLLVLGIGGKIGKEYKLAIFKKIRPYAKNIYVCDVFDNELVPVLIKDKLIDQFIPISNMEPNKAFLAIKKHIDSLNVKLDGIVTYREEWLVIRTLLAESYGLPHPPLNASLISQNKFETRKILESNSICSIKYIESLVDDCIVNAKKFGYPFFIKPVHGIRSEWGRCIENEQELLYYVSNVKSQCDHSDLGTFIIEEYINGHEVDVDMVLYNGNLVYATLSDNFPPYKPFGLESGHLMPSILNLEDQNKITDCALKAVKACGYDRGVFHIELITKPNGSIYVLEVNGRLGGMYIAKWHEEIFGVDLIKAELAIAADIDPMIYLKKNKPTKAFAQLCITTNSVEESNNQKEYDSIKKESMEIYGWDCEFIRKDPQVYNVESWLNFPCKKELAINGHPNIGEITVVDKTPLLAFQKLMHVCSKHIPLVRTNKGDIWPSTNILRKFALSSPNITRYEVREATNSDLSQLITLLKFLTNNIESTSLENDFLIPDDTRIIIVEDKFLLENKIVGSITMHFWNRIRPSTSKTCYVYDLIVHPHYRNIGIGKQLIESSLKNIKSHKINKVDLACENGLVGFYEKFGFKPVAVHLVQYFNYVSDIFSIDKIKHKGEWLYGQDIVVDDLMPHDSNLSIPKHFFITKNEFDSLDNFVNEIYSDKRNYSIKYSLNGESAFTYDNNRGANSSRGRKLDTTNLSKHEILCKLKEFITQAPQNCAALVLQTFIDQSNGCLFHAELKDDVVEIDVVLENFSDRAYSLSHAGKTMIYDEIVGSGRLKNKRQVCKTLTDRCRLYYDILKVKYGDISWSIEGFWMPEKEKVIILQLRPTPKDRITSPLRYENHAFRSPPMFTHFTYGSYDIWPMTFKDANDGLLCGDTFVYIRKGKNIDKLEEVILNKLKTGKKVLLIDPFRGFVLSHEKWFLPPPELRHNFSFIHINRNTIDKFWGAQIRVFSSGNTGCFVVE